jgi:hypothetical protein
MGDTNKGSSYLSIPSFKWYSADGLTEGRMSLACEAHGRQIFAIGGRLAWENGAGAGCYGAPAFIYDAQTEAVTDQFDVRALHIHTSLRQS